MYTYIYLTVFDNSIKATTALLSIYLMSLGISLIQTQNSFSVLGMKPV